MAKIQPRMPISVIDIHIKELISAWEGRAKDPMRFYYKGAFAHALRNDIDRRLQEGMDYSMGSAVASDFWMELLERYEKINDLLQSYEKDVEISEVVRRIFKTEYVEE